MKTTTPEAFHFSFVIHIGCFPVYLSIHDDFISVCGIYSSLFLKNKNIDTYFNLNYVMRINSISLVL